MGEIKKKCARRGKHVRKKGVGLKRDKSQSGAKTFGLKDEDLKKNVPHGMKSTAPLLKVKKLTRALTLVNDLTTPKFKYSKESIMRVGMEFLEHVASEPTCVSVNKFFIERGFPRCEVHEWGKKYPEFATIKQLAKEFIEDRLVHLGVFENVNGRMVEMILKVHYGWKKKELLIEKEVNETSSANANNTFIDFMLKVKENYDRQKLGIPPSNAERELSVVKEEIDKIEDD